MKISTQLFFDRASTQMVQTQTRLQNTQAQLATGKQVTQASDAPDQASSLQRLRSFIDQQESYRDSLGRLSDRLQSQDTILQNVSGMLIRLRELSVQYSNGTLSPDQRRIAAVEVRGIRDQLLSLANSRDANNQALFAGADTAGQAYDAQGIYQGDHTSNQMAVSNSRLIADQRVGSDIFVSVNRNRGLLGEEAVGFFRVIDEIAEGLELNDVQAVSRGISEIGQIHQGISMAQAAVGADMNVVESQTDLIEDQLVTLRNMQSEIEDVDYTEAVTRMQRDMLSLQAAQSSFAQISRMTLFDYLR